MIGGVHQDTAKQLLLGAGVFLADFDYRDAADAADVRRLVREAVRQKRGLIGATQGTSTFSCVPKLRELNANGLRNPYVGGTVCDGWTVKMTGTMLEISPENLRRVLGAGRVEKRGGMTVVTAGCGIDAEDYLPNLCWVGRHGSGYVLIELLGALNMSGAVLTIRDKGEGSMPFSFVAHAPDPEMQDEAPFRIVYLTGGEDA